MVKDSIVSLRIPAELRAQIERVAEAHQRPMSFILMKAIREYLADELMKFKKS
jgi:predicted transcriptional regulator